MNILTEEQVKEFQGILGEMKGGWAEIKALPATFKTLQDESGRLREHVADVRRLLAARHQGGVRARSPGLVSDDCAAPARECVG